MIHVINLPIALKIGEPEAILLQKIASFLSGKPHKLKEKKGKWIYNSLRAWKDNHFPNWTMYKLRKTIKSLESQNLLNSYKANSKKWDQTKWYSINEVEYSKLVREVFPVESIEKTSTNQCDGIQQMYNITKINYNKDTKVSSFKKAKRKNNFKNSKQNFDYKLNELINNSNLNNKQLKKVKEMKRLWDEVFEYSINSIKAYINKNNNKVLYRLLEEKFQGDLNKWKEYAYKVNSSKFLMGEKNTKTGFKASFAWLIKEETVDKINAGEYGIGDRELDQNKISSNIEIQKEELVKVADKKISEYIKDKIDDDNEFHKFKLYIEKNEHLEDEDKYGIGIYVQNIGSYDLISNPDNKGVLKTMYDTYLMKKYTQFSRFEIREQLRAISNNQVHGKSLQESFNKLQNLKEIIVLNNINLETSKLQLLL